ncbi:MAG: hypothetical protein ACRECU_13320, partial [Methylocella sp.]
MSVPLAIVAYFVQCDAAKIGLFATALLCAVFASYWIWKVERDARINAETAANRKVAQKNIRLSLSEFLSQGNALISRCRTETGKPPP